MIDDGRYMTIYVPPQSGYVMDGYIKWNCYDLAVQAAAMEQCEQELNDYYGELLYISQKQIETSTDTYELLQPILPKVKDAIYKMKTENHLLDQCIDIYYAAETQVRLEVETLRTSVPGVSTPVESTSASAGSAVMEDWLATLVHQHNQDEE